MKDYGMYQGYNVEGVSETNMTSKQEIEYNTPIAGTTLPGTVMPEVIECPKEKQIHRTICHTVPQV